MTAIVKKKSTESLTVSHQNKITNAKGHAFKVTS
jgi:hypothetical protein